MLSDKTSPTVKDCPKDIVKTTGRIAEIISWKEPQFSDNVAIRHIMNPVRKSGQSWYPGEDIFMQYIATDIAGNQVKCSFNVALKSKKEFNSQMYIQSCGSHVICIFVRTIPLMKCQDSREFHCLGSPAGRDRCISTTIYNIPIYFFRLMTVNAFQIPLSQKDIILCI